MIRLKPDGAVYLFSWVIIMCLLLLLLHVMDSTVRTCWLREFLPVFLVVGLCLSLRHGAIAQLLLHMLLDQLIALKLSAHQPEQLISQKACKDGMNKEE